MRKGLDYHIHTFYQKCGNETLTVEAIIRKAEALHLSSIAITDHLNSLEMLDNFRLIKRDIDAVETDIEVFFGAELNYTDCDGGWAYSEAIRNDYGFEIAIGGIHSPYTTEDNPRNIMDIQHRHHIRTLEDPLVDVLVHPYWFCRPVWDNNGLTWWDDLLEHLPESRITELADASRTLRKPIEINASAIFYNSAYSKHFKDSYVEFVRQLATKGAFFAVASDAHDINQLGSTEYIEGLLDGIGVLADHVWQPVKRK